MRLLTVAQACEALAIGRTTFYALVGSGQLTAFKVRGGTRVSDREIDRFIREEEERWKNSRRRRDHTARGSRGGRTASIAADTVRGR